MTGREQHARLLAYVTEAGKRNRWPEVARPFKGGVFRGETAWRAVLKKLAGMHNGTAIEALAYLADQLRRVRSVVPLARPER